MKQLRGVNVMIYQKTMELHILSLLVTLMTNFACSTSWSDSFSLLQCWIDKCYYRFHQMFRICWLKSKTINFSQSKNWWNSHIICKKTKPACKKNNIPQTVIKVKLNGLHISQRCQPLEAWNLETFSFALPPPPPPPKSLTHPTINFFWCKQKVCRPSPQALIARQWQK